jgi:hypothetical protein
VAHDQAANNNLHARGQSFLVQVKFRQNNCWQGTIQWLEGQKTCSFRSLLEMLRLMDEALEITTASEDKQDSRSWTTAAQEIAETKSLFPWHSRSE